MERIFKDSRTIQRYRSGPLGLYVQQCAERLCQQGYTREHAHRHIYTVDDFGRWLERHRVALSDVTFDHARRYLDVGRRWKKHGDVAALKRLFEMLAQEGVIPRIGAPQTEAQLVVHNFGTFLREERALAHRTISNRKTIVTAFLTQGFSRRSFQFSNIKAKDLIGFVQKEVTRRRNSIKTVETALRLRRFLRSSRSRMPRSSGDQRVAAAGLSLGQDLAGNACVAFSMIGDLDRAARAHGDRGYRYVHFEAGAIGHRLYLAAEALGLGATGIGAFYNEEVHRHLNLAPEQGRVVYHFAIGYPVPDYRLGA